MATGHHNLSVYKFALIGMDGRGPRPVLTTLPTLYNMQVYMQLANHDDNRNILLISDYIYFLVLFLTYCVCHSTEVSYFSVSNSSVESTVELFTYICDMLTL